MYDYEENVCERSWKLGIIGLGFGVLKSFDWLIMREGVVVGWLVFVVIFEGGRGWVFGVLEDEDRNWSEEDGYDEVFCNVRVECSRRWGVVIVV